VVPHATLLGVRGQPRAIDRSNLVLSEHLGGVLLERVTYPTSLSMEVAAYYASTGAGSRLHKPTHLRRSACSSAARLRDMLVFKLISPSINIIENPDTAGPVRKVQDKSVPTQ
jgi:hypothetical protein